MQLKINKTVVTLETFWYFLKKLNIWLYSPNILLLDIGKQKWESLSRVQLFVTLWTIYRFPSPGNLPNPGIKPRSPALQVDSLPAEPQGKPKHIGVGSLSLLQRIVPIQELNWGLLHCRQILYQLSYQGSPSRYLPRETKEYNLQRLVYKWL